MRRLLQSYKGEWLLFVVGEQGGYRIRIIKCGVLLPQRGNRHNSSSELLGRAYSLLSHGWAQNLGRCPRLVWGWAVGPFGMKPWRALPGTGIGGTQMANS